MKNLKNPYSIGCKKTEKAKEPSMRPRFIRKNPDTNNRFFFPHFVNGNCINGCLPKDSESERIQEELKNSAVEFGTVWELGEMPILKWDDALTSYLKEQAEQCDALREQKICLFPWEVLRQMPQDRKISNRLYWSQGQVGSCMGHADSFAHHSTVLTQIGRGVPLIYDPFNPLVTWALTKNGSISGGQTVAEMAEGANSIGHFPESLVGENNQRLPSYKNYVEDAKKFQSALAFIPSNNDSALCDYVFLCCRAGYAVAIGQSMAVSGATKDSNGIKVARLGGSWAHATSFTSYRKVGDAEYIFWVNSHGNMYGISDEGEPADGCWMDRSIAQRFLGSADGYGDPYVVFPESTIKPNNSLVPPNYTYPSNFRW